MNKKIIIILILILLLACAAGAFYYLTQSPSGSVSGEQTRVLQIRQVVNQEVNSPVAAHNNSSIWYFNSSGKLFSINPDGAKKSEFPLPTLSNGYFRNAIWPKIGEDFIVATGLQEIVWSYYDSKAKIFVNLPKNIQSIDWLPDGKRVVYVWKAEDGKISLVMANADGTGYKKIADLFWSNLVPKASDDEKTVLLYRPNPSEDINKVYIANLETGEILTLIDQGKVIAADWISGNKFLFERDAKIYIYDIASKKSTDLNLKTTLDRIAVDASRKVLYANVDGEFVKVDLNSNKIENYFKPETKITAKSLFLVGNTVYYTDNTDRKLYSITK